MTVAEYQGIQSRIAEIKQRIAALKEKIALGMVAMREVYGVDMEDKAKELLPKPEVLSSRGTPVPVIKPEPPVNKVDELVKRSLEGPPTKDNLGIFSDEALQPLEVKGNLLQQTGAVAANIGKDVLGFIKFVPDMAGTIINGTPKEHEELIRGLIEFSPVAAYNLMTATGTLPGPIAVSVYETMTEKGHPEQWDKASWNKLSTAQKFAVLQDESRREISAHPLGTFLGAVMAGKSGVKQAGKIKGKLTETGPLPASDIPKDPYGEAVSTQGGTDIPQPPTRLQLEQLKDKFKPLDKAIDEGKGPKKPSGAPPAAAPEGITPQMQSLRNELEAEGVKVDTKQPILNEKQEQLGQEVDPAMTKAAEETGTRYEGYFEHPTKGKLHQFTDPLSDNTTVGVYDLADLPAKLEEKRKQYREDNPVGEQGGVGSALKNQTQEAPATPPAKTDRWQTGAEPAAAIPGEPVAFFDADKNMENPKAMIVYDENADNTPAGFKIVLEDGTVLSNPMSGQMGGSPYFETVKEAMDYTEEKLGGKAETPAVEKTTATDDVSSFIFDELDALFGEQDIPTGSGGSIRGDELADRLADAANTAEAFYGRDGLETGRDALDYEVRYRINALDIELEPSALSALIQGMQERIEYAMGDRIAKQKPTSGTHFGTTETPTEKPTEPSTEPPKADVPIPSATKEPWEMTRDEWALAQVPQIAEKLSPEWQKEVKDREKARDAHRKAVEARLAAGESVQRRVLNEYPDLELKYKPTEGSKPILNVAKKPEEGGIRKLPTIGESAKIFQVNAYTVDTQRIDGVDYELWKEHEKEGDQGVIRVIDADSGNMVTLKKFPTFKHALSEYEDVIKKNGGKTPAISGLMNILGGAKPKPAEPSKTPESNDYYVSLPGEKGEVQFKKVDGEKVVIPGFENTDLFVHEGLSEDKANGGDAWVVSEGSTGLKLNGGPSKEEAIAITESVLQQYKYTEEKLAAKVKEQAKFSGYSPRFAETLRSGSKEIDQLAKDYAAALGQGLKDFHIKIATELVDRKTDLLMKFIATGKGNNEVTKKFFTAYTGVKLPPTIEGKRKALQDWAASAKTETPTQPADAGGTGIPGKTASEAVSAPVPAGEGVTGISKKPEESVAQNAPNDVIIDEVSNVQSQDIRHEGSPEDTGKAGRSGVRRVSDDGDTQGRSPAGADEKGLEGRRGDTRSVDSDVHGNEQPARTDLSGDELLTGSAGVAGHRAPVRPGQDLPRPAANEVVPTAHDSGTPADKASVGKANFDLREKEPVILSRGERKRLNDQVKQLLEKDPKEITDADRELLRQYTGEGGLSSGTVEALNQHYTDYYTIRAMFDAIDQSGFKFKTALEPAVGSGSFVGNRPQAKWTTVDIDKTNHEVVKRLYPKADHYLTSFEDYTDTGFDLVISNVPFSEQRGAGQMRARRDIKALHDFYFVHALDRVKDDGIVAFITSTGTMDKGESKYRKEIIDKADIVGAFRLPQGHFTAGAHTDVTTDIIFMHKRPDGVPAAPDQEKINQQFVNSIKKEDGVYLSEYYRENPDNVLGTMTLGVNKLYGGVPTYVVEGPADLSLISFNYEPYGVPAVAAPVDDVPHKYKDFIKWASENGIEYRDGEDPNFGKRVLVNWRNGTVQVGGEILKFSDVNYRVRIYSNMGAGIGTQLVRLDRIRDLAGEYQETQNKAIAEQALMLIDDYQRTFTKHPLNDVPLKKFMKEHGEESYLMELGSFFDKDFTPAPVFFEKTRYIGSGEIEVDTKSPLMHRAFRSEDNQGTFILEKSKHLKPQELKELLDSGYAISAFDGKETELQNSILYTSGNIYKKLHALDEAEAAAKANGKNELLPYLKAQREALEQIKPVPKLLEDIRIKGTEKWLVEVLEQHGMMEADSKINQKTGNREWTHYDSVIERYLNNEALITRRSGGEGANSWVEPMNEYMERLAEAEDKVERWLERLRTAIARRPDVLQQAEYAYNSRMRSYVKPNYAKAQYLIQDVLDEIAANQKTSKKPITLRQNQVAWVIKAMYEGKGINAHGVGAGKTYTAVTLAAALKKRGAAKKPMIVVPAKTTEKWKTEIHNLFPKAKVISLGKLPAEKRTQALFDLANNNADFVLIAHEGFEQIKLAKEDELRYINAVIKEHLEDENVKGREGGKLKLKIEKYREALTKEVRDPRLTFDKLGVDAILVDEAHKFRNIGINTELQKFGLGASFDFGDLKEDIKTGELHTRPKSARSYDMRFKANYIVENNSGKNVFLLTATPTVNKPMELYTMIRHLSPEVFHEYGIYSDRDFANMFFELGTHKDPNKGTPKNVLRKIVNFQELRGIQDRFVDFVPTTAMPWIKVPTANVEQHFLEQSDAYALIAEDLRRREKEKPSKPQAGDDMTISIYGGARAASIDPRLYSSPHAKVRITERSYDVSDDKVEFVIDQVSERIKKNPDHHQLIFLDKSGEAMVQRGELPDDLHSEIKKELVKRGFKPQEIAIINGKVVTNIDTGRDTGAGDPDVKKQAVADAYNEGKVKVVIGTTQSMGEGMDLQGKTKDIWHLDIPYTPGEYIQRNGRGVRQGNIHDVVNIHYMFMKGTFDTMSYGLVSNKKGWNEAIWDKEVANEISTADEMAGGLFPSPERITIELEVDPFKKHSLIVEYQLTKLNQLLSDQQRLMRATSTKISRIESVLRVLDEQLKERQQKLANAVPNEKVKDPAERAEAFEKTKLALQRQIETTERNIKENTESLERTKQRLAKITEEVGVQRAIVADFRQKYYDEAGEVLPLKKLFTNPSELQDVETVGGGTLGEAMGGGRRRFTGKKPLPKTARESQQPKMTPEGEVKPVSKQDIIDYYSKGFGTPFRVGRFRDKAYGIYKIRPEVIRSKTWGDLTNIAHELGHHIEKKMFGGFGNRSLLSNRIPLEARRELIRMGKALYGDRKPDGGYRSEGFAEFIAHYSIGSDTRSLAPTFHTYFENYLNSNPKMKELLEGGRELTTRWYQQGARARVRMSREQGTFGEKIQKIGELFQREQFEKGVALFRDLWVNPGATIELFESEARGMTTRDVMDPEKVDPYTSPSQTYRAESFGAGSQARSMVMNGVFDYNGRLTYKSLNEVLEPVSKDIETFMDYAQSKVSLLLHERNLDPGITKEDAQFTVDQLETPEYKEVLEDLTGWQNAVLEYLVDAGGLSRKSADAMRLLNYLYIPAKRVMSSEGVPGTGRKMGDVKSPIMRKRGSGRPWKNVMNSIIEQTARIISTANRIRVGRLIVDLAEANEGMGKWVEKIPMPQKVTKVAISEIAKALGAAGVNLEYADVEQIISIYENTNRGVPKDNIVTIWTKDGHLETYQFDPQLYRSVMNLDGIAPNVFLKIFGAPARMLRLTTTGIAPAFALTTNPIRDAFTFAMQSKYTSGLPHKIVMGLVRKFFPNEANKVYLRSGSDMGQILGMDKNSIKEAVAEVLANDKKAKAMGIVLHPIDHLREALSLTESGPRRAEFEAAYEKLLQQYASTGHAGASARIGATVAGKDVTTDFTRIGKYMQYVNMLIPFTGAWAGGMSKFARTIGARPKRSLAYGLGLTAVTVALWWEQKDEDWYKSLPAWRKYAFWNFKLGEHDDGTPWILSIPTPFEWGITFKAIPEAMLNAHYANDPSAMKELVGHIKNQLIPDPMPAAIAPLYENATNYDLFRDRQIIPQWMEENRVPEDQYFESTPKTYRELGEWLGYSPVKLQHLTEGYTGGLLTGIIRSSEQGFSVKQPADIPVVGKLFARQYSPEENKEFKEESWKRAKQKVTVLTKGGHFDEAEQVVGEWAFKNNAENSTAVKGELESIRKRKKVYLSNSKGKIRLK